MIRIALVSSLVLTGTVVLGGCSSLLKSEAPPVQIYVLRAAATPGKAATAEAQALDTARAANAAAPNAARPGAMTPPSLQVPRPQADPGLATELITLVRSDHRMDRYAASSWAGALPDVVKLWQSIPFAPAATGRRFTTRRARSRRTISCRSPSGASKPTTPAAAMCRRFT